MRCSVPSVSSLEELERQYVDVLNRLAVATKRQQEVFRPAESLSPGQEPPPITPEQRKAQNDSLAAWQDYIKVRDVYWPKKWGTDGNPKAGQA